MFADLSFHLFCAAMWSIILTVGWVPAVKVSFQLRTDSNSQFQLRSALPWISSQVWIHAVFVADIYPVPLFRTRSTARQQREKCRCSRIWLAGRPTRPSRRVHTATLRVEVLTVGAGEIPHWGEGPPAQARAAWVGPQAGLQVRPRDRYESKSGLASPIFPARFGNIFQFVNYYPLVVEFTIVY